MNLIRLISHTALHIFGHRSLLVWSLFAYFICTSCSNVQVREGITNNIIQSNAMEDSTISRTRFKDGCTLVMHKNSIIA